MTMAAACVHLRLYICLVIFSSGKSIFEPGYFSNRDKARSVEDCVGLKGDGSAGKQVGCLLGGDR